MPTCLLLALESTPAGDPACLLDLDGRCVVERLIGQLPEGSTVWVVARAHWAERIAARLPDIEVVGVADPGELIEAIDAVPEGRLAILPAETVTNDLAIARMTDHAATGTGMLAAAVGQSGVHGPTQPVAEVRGRIVAMGSALHQADSPSHLGLGAWSVAAGARASLTAAMARVRELPLHELLPDAVLLSASAELLPVALVREGTTLTVTRLPPGLVWDRPRDDAEVARTVPELRAVDEDRVRLDVAVKAEDGFFTTFFVSTYSRYWARWAARRGLTPDQVTLASMALGLVAAGGFASGTLAGAVIGAVSLQLAFTLDCVDGQLARYSRDFSTFGAWLDSIFDRGKEYVVYAGLAVGGVRAGDGDGLWWLAASLLALQTFRHTVDLGYAEQQRRDVDTEVHRPLLDGLEDREATFWQATQPDSSASLPRRILGWLRIAEGVPGLKWLKRIVVLPIGERFALISVLSIVSGPRLVFIVLLAWGALAAAYTVGGRAIRSVV